jgi:4-carboxymuconolactone decarboxylase
LAAGREINRTDKEKTMARIPVIDRREDLTPAHQQVFDAIAKSRGAVRGVFPALLHVPTIADHTASLGGYLRFDGKLDPKVRTLAAMTASRELDCIHEWAASVRNAEKNKVSRATLVAVHQRQPTAGLPADEAEIVDYTRDLLQRHRVGAAVVESLRQRLGVAGLVELTATIGYYAMISCTLNAFDLSSSPNPTDLPI